MAPTLCDARHDARALVTWLHEEWGTLTYCGHCSDARAEDMTRAEWVQVKDEREAWVGVT